MIIILVLFIKFHRIFWHVFWYIPIFKLKNVLIFLFSEFKMMWWIHVAIWQNQYNIVKLKNKIK